MIDRLVKQNMSLFYDCRIFVFCHVDKQNTFSTFGLDKTQAWRKTLAVKDLTESHQMKGRLKEKPLRYAGCFAA